MRTVDELIERERTGNLDTSISVGVDIVGLMLSVTNMKEIDATQWMKWHDKWECMDKNEQDSYLILLALKGVQ